MLHERHRSGLRMRSSHLVVVIGLLLMTVVPIARSEKWQDEVSPGQVIGIPVYDPESKRYFALMHADDRAQSYHTWGSVADQARSQVYKDARGRLAIVDSAEVHSFLLRTFRPNGYQYIWIGLRYLCRSKKLEWSDGRLWQPGSFQLWDTTWNQDVWTCSDKNNPNDWAPVGYTPSMRSWIVKGNQKGYPWYFIEYPTGSP
jgi:hypothetical protein